jgi:hypothetical protein
VQPTVSQSEIAKPALAMKAKPYKVEIKDGSDGADWRAWAQKLIAFARGETTLEGIAAWLEENDGALQDMRELEPKMYRMFEQAIDAHRQGIAPNVDEDTGEVM